MSCVVKNIVDCDNLRKMTINQLNVDNTTTVNVIYFDIVTGDQVSLTDAQQCPTIQALEFTCATVCVPTT